MDDTTRMTDGAVSVVPANQAGWGELQAIFGTRGDPSGCQCQWFKIRDSQWHSVPVEERAERLREQTGCGNPEARTTSGLVAYLDGEPAGWCADEPRTAVTCFVTRTGFRRRGVSRALAHAAVEFARSRGARAIEGYPMITSAGQAVSWGELYVGSRSIFADAGFAEVSTPTPRRVVMRIDFQV
jgi:GNAT superfamily N-acetyltransferase